MGQNTEELKREIEATRSDMGATLDAIGDRVSPSRVVERKKNKVIVGARSLKDRVMGTAGDTQHQIAETAHSAHDAVTDAVSQASDAVKSVPDVVVHRTEGAPMVAGAIAFGLGFIVAASMPATQPEVDASAKLMETLEPVKQELTDTAHEMVDELKDPAIEAAQHVKQVATEGVHAVTATAGESARDTAEQANASVAAVAELGSDESATTG